VRRRNSIRILLISLVIATGLVAALAARPAKNETPCKESLDECCRKDDGNKVMWESIPHQFFSSVLN
jgi:hypothetical protein